MPEREVKLAGSPGFRMPALNDLMDGITAEHVEPRRLDTTYHDTPDLRLARWGCSLRYRAGEGWTVKLPAQMEGPLLVRGEHVFDGDGSRPPERAVDLLRAYVRTAALVRVVRLRTIRRPVLLRDQDGRLMAEVVDDEVSVLDGRRLAARFRELEIEVTADIPFSLLDRIIERLTASGAGLPDPTPKYIRALGPRGAQPPEVVPPPLASGATAGDVVRHALAASVIRLIRHDAVVRLDADDEGVHQARIATRRIRSDLRTFDPLVDPGWANALREELRWLADALGTARDADVMRTRLRSRIEALDDVTAAASARLVALIEDARRSAHQELLERMRARRYAELLDRLEEAARSPSLLLAADPPAVDVLPGLLSKPWEDLRSAVKQLSNDPSPSRLHEVRIKAKRCRYAAEAIAPLAGQRAGAFARAAAKLQDVLGEHQDAVVAEAWLRATAVRSRSVRTAFVAGELAGLERAAAEAAAARWRPAWRKLKRSGPETWS